MTIDQRNTRIYKLDEQIKLIQCHVINNPNIDPRHKGIQAKVLKRHQRELQTLKESR